MVVATLALALGPATAVFGMIDQLLRRPLPGAAKGEEAAYLQFAEYGNGSVSLEDFDELRANTTLVSGVASYGLTSPHVSLGAGRPISVLMNTVYGDFFEVLGVEAADGRLLSASESGLDADPLVIVISGHLRDRLFGAEEEVVGRTLQVAGQPMTVVGVTGGGFRGPQRELPTDAWIPFSALVPIVGFTPERLSSRNSIMHGDLLVLPRPGATPEAVEEQVQGILDRLTVRFPESADNLTSLAPRVHVGLHATPGFRENTARTMSMMAWAVALVLLIACANVANLLLFRNLARRGAMATRRVLGASTGRIARQQMVESGLLAVTGAVAGLVVAWLIMRWFAGYRLGRAMPLDGFEPTPSMLGGLVLLVAGTALLFGVVPAALAGRFDLGDALRSADRRETGRMGWLRGTLSAGQIALSLALVAGGLLMVRTISNLRSVATGVDVDGVVHLIVESPSGLTPDDMYGLRRRLLADVEQVPGVERATLDLYGPHGPRFIGLIGLPGTPREDALQAMLWPVTPGWFEVFRMQTLRGRVFEDADWEAPPSRSGVVLTASLARRLFGRVDVVGEAVQAGPRGELVRPVIGVVSEYRSLVSPGEPTDAFFVTYGEGGPVPASSLFARTTRFDEETAEGIRAVAEELLPNVPVADPIPVSANVESLHAQEAMIGRLLWILSAFCLLMSAVGLYGVIHFVVSRRKRELGIRVALGADRARILRLVGRSAMLIVTTGTVLGLGAAYALSRVLRSWLFEVEPVDLASYSGAAALLVLVAVVACIAPARAALGVDPVETLRQE
jgi:predicted permease